MLSDECLLTHLFYFLNYWNKSFLNATTEHRSLGISKLNLIYALVSICYLRIILLLGLKTIKKFVYGINMDFKKTHLKLKESLLNNSEIQIY